jgi:hypothetical protein
MSGGYALDDHSGLDLRHFDGMMRQTVGGRMAWTAKPGHCRETDT